MKRIIILITALLLLLCTCGCEPVSETGYYFDTIVTVTVYDGERQKAADSALDLCKYYDRLFDMRDPDSEIYALNHSGGTPVEVSPETAELISLGLYYSDLSDGLFDITCGAVTSLWDFSADDPQIPDPDVLSSALATVDYTRVTVDGCTVTVPDGSILDLGGIAKGYIADKINAMLDEHGVTKTIISLGGNVYAKGASQSDKPWRIGIQSPFNASEYSYIAEITDRSAVTSGTYQRYFELDGETYHHILSMQTGMPVTTDLASATIISPNSASCDALSTICMLLGYERANELINSLEDTHAVFVLTDGSVKTTLENA